MKTKVICNVDEPTPIAYEDLYDEGDRWIKIQGCEACPLESRLKCCGECGMLWKKEGKCAWHLEDDSKKPFHCVATPVPTEARSFCKLEYKCIKGPKTGWIRRLCDPGNFFHKGHEWLHQ